jgi:hypothetical protein
VAAILADRSERILVISTTNKATDGAAISVGEAARKDVGDGRILRIGKNSEYDRFQNEGLEEMLKGTETELLRIINRLSRQLKKTESRKERAKINQNLLRLRRELKDRALDIFLSPKTQVVISTAFREQ